MPEGNFYTVEQVKALAGVSVHTVHKWVEEFADYFSPTANPGKGKAKKFTEADMSVLMLIAEEKAEGRHFADIHAALASGRRGGIPESSPDELKALMTSDARRDLAAQNEALLRQIDELRREVTRLTPENIRLQTQVDLLTEMLGKSQDNENGLREQIGELRGELKALKRQTGQE